MLLEMENIALFSDKSQQIYPGVFGTLFVEQLFISTDQASWHFSKS